LIQIQKKYEDKAKVSFMKESEETHHQSALHGTD